MEPMMGTGCIYHDNKRLAGQAFIFQGKVDREAAERLKKHGFTVIEDKEDGSIAKNAKRYPGKYGTVQI